MSNRYKGGVISATPPTTTGGESGTASGAWTLEQQMQLRAAGLWPLQPTGPYIEELFSTYLYTGNATARSITNEIDLAGKGGLVWIKQRTVPSGTGYHFLYDSARGGGGGPGFAFLSSNTNAANGTNSDTVSTFNSNGFSLGTDSGGWGPNRSGSLEVSWTFRKQPKFFDVLTYTGNGTAGTAISHSLGSTPGFILVKRTDTGGSTGQNWVVWHRSAGGTGYFNSNNALDSSFPNSIFWGNGSSYVAPTSTTFTVTDSQNVNASGGSYVAYLFAHDAGGFGLTGTDNVISCGSFTTGNGGKISAPVNLGYEAQWLLAKNVDSAENWVMYDIMRGMNNTGYAALNPNTSGAEYTGTSAISPTATGFDTPNASGPFASFANYIYIAIRRGPMRIPTTGTSVFTPATRTGTGSATTITSAGFPVDLAIGNSRNAVSYGAVGAFGDRLRGKQNLLYSEFTNAEDTTNASITGFDVQNGISVGGDLAYSFNTSGGSYVNWFMRRAPGFFDEVCYSGTGGSGQTIPHNLGVAPELLIFKKRNSTSNWTVVMPAIGGNAVSLNLNDYGGNSNIAFVSSFGTSSITTAAGYDNLSESGSTYVAYFFATCPGVSKVGNYAGTGAALTVDCGFTSGARFVMIKRLDGTNIYRGWYVWDSARGITSGNDPYLLMNNTNAETTGTNYVDSASSGFTLTTDSAGASGGALNASGGTYIFLAIA